MTDLVGFSRPNAATATRHDTTGGQSHMDAVRFSTSPRTVVVVDPRQRGGGGGGVLFVRVSGATGRSGVSAAAAVDRAAGHRRSACGRPGAVTASGRGGRQRIEHGRVGGRVGAGRRPVVGGRR